MRKHHFSRPPYEINRHREREHRRNFATGARLNSHYQVSTEIPMAINQSESYIDSSNYSITSTTTNSTASNVTHTSMADYNPYPTNNAQVASHLPSSSQVTLANLPKLISQFSGRNGIPNLSELSPQEALRTIQQALELTKQVTNLPQTTDSHHSYKPSASLAQSHYSAVASNAPVLNGTSTYTVNSASGSPFSDRNVEVLDRDRPSTSSYNNAHSASSLQGLNATTRRNYPFAALWKLPIPTLTPSLKKYNRDDFTSHVIGSQAHYLERQADHYWKEAYKLGSLHCTEVSTDLKMARARVRLEDINVTQNDAKLLLLKEELGRIEASQPYDEYVKKYDYSL